MWIPSDNALSLAHGPTRMGDGAVQGWWVGGERKRQDFHGGDGPNKPLGALVHTGPLLTAHERTVDHWGAKRCNRHSVEESARGLRLGRVTGEDREGGWCCTSFPLLRGATPAGSTSLLAAATQISPSRCDRHCGGAAPQVFTADDRRTFVAGTRKEIVGAARPPRSALAHTLLATHCPGVSCCVSPMFRVLL